MSSPSPVESPPLVPRVSRSSVAPANPVPSSSTTTVPSRTTQTRKGTPSSVCAKTLPSSASRAASRSSGSTATQTASPSVSSSRYSRPLVLGEHGPEGDAAAGRLGQVARRGDAVADRTPRLGDQPVDGPLQLGHVRAEALPVLDVAHRLRVE